MRLTLLLCLLLIYLPCGQAQQALDLTKPSLHQRPRPYTPPVDLNGTWVGELYQDAGGIAETFELSMQLQQIGITIKGTSYVRFGDIWAEMEFSGFQAENGSWKITESKVVRAEKPKDLSWCMKSYELRLGYTSKGIVLSGPWWGNSDFGPCVPGSVRLMKKKKQV